MNVLRIHVTTRVPTKTTVAIYCINGWPSITVYIHRLLPSQLPQIAVVFFCGGDTRSYWNHQSLQTILITHAEELELSWHREGRSNRTTTSQAHEHTSKVDPKPAEPDADTSMPRRQKTRCGGRPHTATAASTVDGSWLHIVGIAVIKVNNSANKTSNGPWMKRAATRKSCIRVIASWRQRTRARISRYSEGVKGTGSGTTRTLDYSSWTIGSQVEQHTDMANEDIYRGRCGTKKRWDIAASTAQIAAAR